MFIAAATTPEPRQQTPVDGSDLCLVKEGLRLSLMDNLSVNFASKLARTEYLSNPLFITIPSWFIYSPLKAYLNASDPPEAERDNMCSGAFTSIPFKASSSVV